MSNDLFSSRKPGDLIHVTEREGKQTVNARELHSFLESKQDYSTWIKGRIEKYGFVEGADYLLHKFMEQTPSGAKQKIDYHVSIDMGKQLAMVENNAKGQEARRYFIECERRALAPIKETPQMLIARALQAANQLVMEMTPKAEAFDRFISSGTNLTMEEAAKDLNIGRNRLFNLLRDMKTLTPKNLPYQKQIEAGRFVVRPVTKEINGHNVIFETTLVTPKGLAWIAEMMK